MVTSAGRGAGFVAVMRRLSRKKSAAPQGASAASRGGRSRRPAASGRGKKRARPKPGSRSSAIQPLSVELVVELDEELAADRAVRAPEERPGVEGVVLRVDV